jgi:hypothetical protein
MIDRPRIFNSEFSSHEAPFWAKHAEMSAEYVIMRDPFTPLRTWYEVNNKMRL